MQMLKWMVSGPEIARIINEFQRYLPFNTDKQGSSHRNHHEQTRSAQERFVKHVKSLCMAFEEVGNPFLEESQDLISLESRNIANMKAVENLRNAENIGTKNFKAFVFDRIKSKKKSVFDTIKQNKVWIFNQPAERSIGNKDELTTLKKSCYLFSQLYIACQVRDGNLNEFFKHENTAFPPSLSKHGELRSGTKSDLIGCLLESIPQSEASENVDCIILDGAAIVNMLKPQGAVTFQDYATKTFEPFIKQQLSHSSRIDIVWDIYTANSLKFSARSKRGT